MFCNKCGAEINEGTLFCPKCGNHLGQKTKSEEVTAESVKEAEMETTMEMGKSGDSIMPVYEVNSEPIMNPTINGQPVFLQQNGQMLNVPYQQPVKKKQSGKILLVVAIVLLILFAAIAALFFTIGQDVLRNRDVAIANRMVEDKEYEDAIEVYEEVLLKDEEHEGAMKGLEEAYLGLLEDALAENKFVDAIEWAEEGKDATDAEEFDDYLEMLESGLFFDSNDRLIKQLIFDEAREITSYMEPTYDDDGNEAEITYYDLNNEKIYAIQNEYDVNGNVIKTYFFEEEGEYSNRSEEYDENGNVIFEIVYDADTGYGIWGEGFNTNGDLITETYYDEMGDLTSLYEYDDFGYLISDTIYYEDGSYVTTKHDEYGNVLQVETYDEFGSYSISEYDNDGYLLYDYFYDAEDTLIYYIGYEYFSDGIYRTSYDPYGTMMYLYDYDEYGVLLQSIKFDSYGYAYYLDEYDEYGINNRTNWYN